MNDLPLSFRAGDLISFDYPEWNRLSAPTAWRRRTVRVQTIRDILAQPLAPVTIQRNPLLARGRWLIKCHDLDLDAARCFYWESMREYRKETSLQLALFDPMAGQPELLFPSNPFLPTVQARQFMAGVISRFNHGATDRPNILLNLGVFPHVDPRARSA